MERCTRWSQPPFVWVSFASAQPPGYPLSRGGQAREGTRAERSSEGRTIHRRNSRTHLQLRQKSCATIHVGGLREEVLLELLQHRLRLFDAHGCCARPRSALRARLPGQQTLPELQSQSGENTGEKRLPLALPLSELTLPLSTGSELERCCRRHERKSAAAALRLTWVAVLPVVRRQGRSGAAGSRSSAPRRLLASLGAATAAERPCISRRSPSQCDHTRLRGGCIDTSTGTFKMKQLLTFVVRSPAALHRSGCRSASKLLLAAERILSQ
eukprot:COSAG06_NODE_2873_length_6147_cov_42.686679_5_plen_270_part_00